MARIPEAEVERMKREISVQRLAEARGVKLKRSGKELLGLCPFHDDKNPSLCIDPVKNVWHCKGACSTRGGSVIDWVMRAEGITVRHALELLRSDYMPQAGPAPKVGTVRKLPAPVESNMDDQAMLQRVMVFYHETLKQRPEAMKYLAARGLTHPEMVTHFKLGFSNRTLGYRLPKTNRDAGAALRGRLQGVGIIRESGHEHFSGSLVIPILSVAGDVLGMYGRKITPNLRDGTPLHLYLPGPHRGVWNEIAFEASKEIILCESLIDALTFWCAGYRHVTASYGVSGFTADLRAAFVKYGTKRVYIAYDRDDAGERAATTLAAELMESGVECFRVQFPKGMDANDYARTTQPAAKSLGVLLNAAEWLGKGQRPTIRVIAAKEEIEKPKPAAKEEKPIPSDDSVSSSAAEPAPPWPMPMATPSEPVLQIDQAGDEITTTIDGRSYRVLGLFRNTSLGVMRVNLKVTARNLRGESCYHGDTLDLQVSRHRATFTKQAAHELGVKEETIRNEVGKLWGKLEDAHREYLRHTLESPKEETILTAAEQDAALELLRDPRLLERVLSDFDKCGVVGEETNKRVAYLAAVSRLLEKPLAIVVQSSSSAGKSSLMEAILDFMPKDQQERYSAMTGQALFYMGQKNLKHKILAMSEEEGASRAAYALKLLQSEGVLKIASTGKDPVSGKHVTHEYIVEGPVMIFLTTTAYQVDEELLNRSIVLTVNEDREQTRAIHRRQREARTIDGHWARRTRERIVKLHQNAQTLLRPIAVVNNLMQDSFPDYMTRTRRDHVKLLTLVEAIAVLHQYQREIKTETRDGETLEYIEATPEDVKLASELVSQVLTPSLDELPGQTRRLLERIEEMIKQECERLQITEPSEYRFTRRNVREHTRWGDTQLRLHLHRLEEMEYLTVRRGAIGQTFVYQLRCTYDANLAGSEDNLAGGVRGGVRGVRGVGSGPVSEEQVAVNATGQAETARFSENTSPVSEKKSGPENGVVAIKANGAARSAAASVPAKPNGTARAHGGK
jgi:DNA primase